jgi:hypothetical protein
MYTYPKPSCGRWCEQGPKPSLLFSHSVAQHLETGRMSTASPQSLALGVCLIT